MDLTFFIPFLIFLAHLCCTRYALDSLHLHSFFLLARAEQGIQTHPFLPPLSTLYKAFWQGFP